jgi:hypothetical protein
VAFGRKKISADVEVDVENFEDDLDEQDRAFEDAELLAEIERTEREARAALLASPTGPFDSADEPASDLQRLDLGSLRVTVLPDTDVRLEVSPEGEVVAATLVQGDTALQLNAFAAPRTEGIWADVRTEIKDALNDGGGTAEEAEGFFGTELRAAVPTEVPGQGIVLAPARFVGVDGPRWFLRGLLTGPGASEDAAAQPLLEAMKQVVVVRGNDPMAVRDPLPLALPANAMEHAEAAALEAGLQMPERGPEITETR